MNIQRLEGFGIDYKEGVERFANKADLYEMFLLKFPEDENYSKLLEHIKEKKLKEAFIDAHSLKGIAGNLSLNKLYGDLSELVEALRHGNSENLSKLENAVQKSYEETLEAIRSCM